MHNVRQLAPKLISHHTHGHTTTNQPAFPQIIFFVKFRLTTKSLWHEIDIGSYTSYEPSISLSGRANSNPLCRKIYLYFFFSLFVHFGHLWYDIDGGSTGDIINRIPVTQSERGLVWASFSLSILFLSFFPCSPFRQRMYNKTSREQTDLLLHSSTTSFFISKSQSTVCSAIRHEKNRDRGRNYLEWMEKLFSSIRCNKFRFFLFFIKNLRTCERSARHLAAIHFTSERYEMKWNIISIPPPPMIGEIIFRRIIEIFSSHAIFPPLTRPELLWT